MTTPVSFEDCYPPEIVEWIAAFPEPSDLSAHQRRTVEIISDPRTIAAAGKYFATLDDCDTPEEANAIINNFRSMLEDTIKPADITALFVGRLAVMQ